MLVGMNENLREHWNNAYLNKSVDELGWYEEIPEPSLELIDKTGLENQARVFVAGAGASTLIDHMLNHGWSNISVCDISNIALDLLDKRLGEKAKLLNSIHDDLLEPRVVIREEPYDLWIDRAVFHFFTRSEEKEAYRHLLNRMLKVNAQLMIATFAPGTAPKCSGLDVQHHNAESLQEFLGSDYELIESFETLYTQPSGNTRDYVYSLFKRWA